MSSNLRPDDHSIKLIFSPVLVMYERGIGGEITLWSFNFSKQIYFSRQCFNCWLVSNVWFFFIKEKFVERLSRVWYNKFEWFRWKVVECVLHSVLGFEFRSSFKLEWTLLRNGWQWLTVVSPQPYMLGVYEFDINS